MNEHGQMSVGKRLFLWACMLLSVVGFVLILVGWLEHPQGVVPLVRAVAQVLTLLLLFGSALVHSSRPRLRRTLLVVASMTLVVFIVTVFL